MYLKAQPLHQTTQPAQQRQDGFQKIGGRVVCGKVHGGWHCAAKLLSLLGPRKCGTERI